MHMCMQLMFAAVRSAALSALRRSVLCAWCGRWPSLASPCPALFPIPSSASLLLHAQLTGRRSTV